MNICTAPGCDRPARTNKAAYCDAHRCRLKATGTLGDAPINPRVTAGVKVTDTPAYRTVHNRIVAARGRASIHPCWCGNPAAQWALVHACPDTLLHSPTGQPYSDDLDCYQPLCVPCHRKMDEAYNYLLRHAPEELAEMRMAR